MVVTHALKKLRAYNYWFNELQYSRFMDLIDFVVYTIKRVLIKRVKWTYNGDTEKNRPG